MQGNMSELLLIVGNSNAGKDWVAENRFANFTLIKLNQAFKDQLELDFGLEPGTCNDKSKRNETLTCGPFKGETIQQAMVISYKQSLNGCGYGAKYSTLTILKTLETIDKLAKTRTPIVITDLRKPIELKFILEFSRLINYRVKMLHVHSDKEIAYDSDKSLYENMDYFERITNTSVQTFHNNY